MKIQRKRFIYLVGEHQDGIIPENTDLLAFTRSSMQQIDSEELALVIANVFGKGQYFPGPEGALSAVIHEFVARSERYNTLKAQHKKERCTLVTALKRLDGEISVKVSAMFAIPSDNKLNLDQPEAFHALLIASLPDFQAAFTEEGYAPDSKIINIIKEATLHHIQSSLQ